MENQTLTLFSCLHCGTDFHAKAGLKFCCHGCETVFALLRSEGLDDYYRLRDQSPPACPIPAQVSTETFDFCDDPEFVQKASPDGSRMTFYLEGVTCTACLWLLEKLPRLCGDTEATQVNMSASTITVARKENGSFAAIARTLNRLGYRPHPLRDNDSTLELQKRERRRDMVRIGIAAAATGNIMILAVSVYGGATGVLGEQFRQLAGLLAAPVLTYCAWPFYRSAWGALRSRTLNLDVPIVAAILAGIAMSLYGLTQGKDVVYFDSLSMLVFLLLSSRFWLKSVQTQHLDVSHLEDELLIGTVTRFSSQKSSQKERVSTLSLQTGDIVEVQPEMTVPCDGQVVSGRGFYQTAVLNGESEPLEIQIGTRIEAGSRNLTGTWLLRVERPASQSRLAQILRDTEQMAKAKPRIVVMADRVSQWFIGLVLFAALGVCAYFFSTQPEEGFTRALALIIVTCPCVFGMAIPLSMSLAIRASARRGLVVKDANALERAAEISQFYFDKTGTLTHGELKVLRIDAPLENRVHLGAVLSLEAEQMHPIARALSAAVAELGITSPGPATDVRLLPAGGIEGKINQLPYTIVPLGQAQSALAGQIRARYGLFLGSLVVAQFEVGDEIRPDARELVQWCRDEGLQIHLLSGDRPSVVEACAKELSISQEETTAGATPELKSKLLKASGSRAAMVGDGANDAAALAAAGLGIAVRGSMDVSLRAADIYLIRPDLRAILELVKLAKRTRSAIRRNLIFSASFNLVAGFLAIVGLMTPLWAAVLMPLSSLTVLLSALATGQNLEGSKK